MIDTIFLVIIGIGLAIKSSIKSLMRMNSEKRIGKLEAILLLSFHLAYFLLLYYMNQDILYHLIFSCLFLVMVITDYKEKMIETQFFLYLFLLSLLSFFVMDKNLVQSVLGSLSGSLPFLLVLWLMKDSVGEGDIYLVCILGFIVEIQGIYYILFISYFLAFLYAVYLVCTKKANRKRQIAMFPFFYMGYLLFLLFYA